MPELVASLEGTIARAGSQLGQWWPNDWWPTGNSSYNDCAAFVSWCLWGLNGKHPYQIVVSGIIERSGLEFHAGAAGIRRGDVAGFRWTLADNYDHTELVLSSPSPLGFIQTIGANGGGSDKVAIHTRSTGYVHNYARPAYRTVSTAGAGSSPLIEGSNDMHVIKNIEQGFPTSNWTALVGEFTFFHHPDQSSQRFDSRVWEGAVDTCIEVNNGEFTYAMAQAQARIAARDKAWGGGSGSFPTDYAKSAEVEAVGAKVDALPKPPTKITGTISQ